MYFPYKKINISPSTPHFVCRRPESSSLLMFMPVFAHVPPLVVHSTSVPHRAPFAPSAIAPRPIDLLYSFLRVVSSPSSAENGCTHSHTHSLMGPDRWQPGICCISSRSQTRRQRITAAADSRTQRHHAQQLVHAHPQPHELRLFYPGRICHARRAAAARRRAGRVKGKWCRAWAVNG
jgi:hypothetical protein